MSNLLSKQFEGEEGKNKRYATVAAGILFALAVLVFCLTGLTAGFAAFMMVLVGILLLLLVVQILLLTFFFGEETPNFFLYDKTRAKNRSREELDIDLVKGKMREFLSASVKFEGQLWSAGALDGLDFRSKDCFRPAVACMMLISLCDHDKESGWKCVSSCPIGTVEWIAGELTETGLAPKFAADLLRVKKEFGTDPRRIRDFLMKNRGYLEGRLLAYAKMNLDRFDGME